MSQKINTIIDFFRYHEDIYVPNGKKLKKLLLQLSLANIRQIWKFAANSVDKIRKLDFYKTLHGRVSHRTNSF